MLNRSCAGPKVFDGALRIGAARWILPCVVARTDDTMERPQTLLLLALALPVGACAAVPESSVGPTPRSEDGRAGDGLLERVLVLGASASAGFHLADPTDQRGLARALATALEPAGTIVDLSEPWTFDDPRTRQAPILGEAAGIRPTLTFALDLPFWFVHGPTAQSGDLSELEWLLEELDPVGGALVLGTVPRLRDDVPTLLFPAAIRAPESRREAANERLTQFAAARDHVHLYDLAATVDALDRGDLSPVRGAGWLDLDPIDVFREDGLHLTAEGHALLTLSTLEFLDHSEPGVLEGRIRWDADALIDALE